MHSRSRCGGGRGVTGWGNGWMLGWSVAWWIVVHPVTAFRFFRYDDIVFTMYGAAPEDDFDPTDTFILEVPLLIQTWYQD